MHARKLLSLVEVGSNQLLDHFFRLHDPVPQRVAQYQSAIFAQSEAQRAVADARLAKLKVATKLLPASKWNDAEEYHQQFVKKSGCLF